MIYLLDTNIFLRVLVREKKDDFQDCVKLLERIKKSDIEAVTAGIVLVETGWVLRSYYKVKKEDVAKKLAGISRLAGLKIVDDYSWSEAIKVYDKHNIKLLDAVLATMPNVVNKKWTIVSYDEDFKKLQVKWQMPRQVLSKEQSPLD